MTDITNLFYIIMAVLLVSAFIYWCLCKHTGILLLYSSGIYLTIAGYLFIMSRYLFSNGLVLPVLLAVTLLLVTGAALYCRYVLLVEDFMRVTGAFIMLGVNLLGFLYACLMAGWSILSPEFVLQVHTLFFTSAGIFAGFLFENFFVHFGTRCFYLWEQCTKLLAGLSVCLLLLCLKRFSSRIPMAQLLLSFCLTFWIAGVYPVLIRRIQRYEYRNL